MTEPQKYYTLLGLVCEDFPHYAVDMAIAAGCPGERQRLHDVKRGRTVSLPDLVALVQHSMPRFKIPTYLRPDGDGGDIEEFIKQMFLLYRVGKLEVSASWLAKAVSEGSQQAMEEREVRNYFKLVCELEPSRIAPKRIRIPIEADYLKLDAQGHPGITAYHCEVARPYTLLVQDWLTADEIQAFSSPVSEVAEQEAVA